MIIFFILIAIVGILFFYRNTIPDIDKRRKFLLVLLRIIAVVSVLVLLFNPILYFSEILKKEPEIIILNDVSDSMKDKAKEMNNLRDNTVKDIKDHKIISYNFADGLEGTNLSTNFSKTLLELSDKMKYVKAVLLFSDGWFKDDNYRFAENLSIPVYAFAPEIKFTIQDLEVSKIHHNQTAYRDEISLITADVFSRSFEGNVDVTLYIKEKQVQKKTISIQPDELKQIEFEHVFDATGLLNVKVKISTSAVSETDIENNSAESVIRVLENRSEILIITDKAGWDVKFLNSAINNNPRWKTSVLLKSGYFKKGNMRTSLEKEMKNVSALIVVNHGKLRLSGVETEMIDRFVENGGGLLLQGKQILKSLLPATNTEIISQFPTTFRFTEKSKQYETFSSARSASKDVIPPVDYFYTEPNLQSIVFAEFNNEEQTPAMLFQEYSAGKVMYFPFLNFWRWQMRDTENSYSNFISNLVLWLSTTNSDRFFASGAKNAFDIGEDVILHLTAFDEKLLPQTDLNAKAVIKNSENKVVYEEYMLAGNEKYTSTLKDLPSGEYTFTVADDITKQQAKGDFTISDDNPEKHDKGINKTLLSYISNATGGKFYSEKDIDNFALKKAEAVTEKIKKEIPIYRKWYLIAAFILSFCTELFFRKRWGLL